MFLLSASAAGQSVRLCEDHPSHRVDVWLTYQTPHPTGAGNTTPHMHITATACTQSSHS